MLVSMLINLLIEALGLDVSPIFKLVFLVVLIRFFSFNSFFGGVIIYSLVKVKSRASIYIIYLYPFHDF